jgi:hypothetical protein
LPAQVRLAEGHAIDDPSQRQDPALGFQIETGAGQGWRGCGKAEIGGRPPAEKRSSIAPSPRRPESWARPCANAPRAAEVHRSGSRESRRADSNIHGPRQALRKHQKEPAPPPGVRQRTHCPAGRAKPRSCGPCRNDRERIAVAVGRPGLVGDLPKRRVQWRGCAAQNIGDIPARDLTSGSPRQNARSISPSSLATATVNGECSRLSSPATQTGRRQSPSP